MLRRVAQVFRAVSLIVGLVAFGLIPFSWVYVAWVVWVREGYFVALSIQNSELCLHTEPATPLDIAGLDAVISRAGVERLPETEAYFVAMPSYYIGVMASWIYIPLWLLAFVCLAWPVTSFILARRSRKGRGGFAVEPAAAAAPPAIDPPRSNLPPRTERRISPLR